MDNSSVQTKFNGVYEADLQKLGCLKLRMTGNTASRFRVQTTSSSNCIVSVEGDHYFTTSTSSSAEHYTTLALTPGTLYDLYFSAGTYNAYISDKYNIVQLRQYSDALIIADANELEYCIELTTITTGNSDSPITFRGDISFVSRWQKLYYVSFNSTIGLYGNIEAFKDKPLLEILYASTTTGLYGDIVNAFGNDIKISNIQLNETDPQLFTGSVEGLVTAQIEAGRTTCAVGALRFNGIQKFVTFGGERHNIDMNRSYLSWNSADEIYITNADSFNSATVILAKGASAAQVETWEQAGKTVIVIN